MDSERATHQDGRASRPCVLAAALCLAALGVVAAGASARGAAAPLLPNLVTRPIVDVHIEKGVDTKLLRFSTIVGNRGPGPAELFPDVPDTSDCDHDGDPAQRSDRQPADLQRHERQTGSSNAASTPTSRPP